MKAKKIVLNAPIHVLADGRVLTDAEFEATVFRYEDNSEVIDSCAKAIDPKFRAMEIAKRRFERVESRRQELERQQEHIKNELAKIT